ncbi:MAG: ketoacyl-ACP synthase III [Bacteroidaceae bacterium]|nr:ketoacyl-ACP synthase III [Bacteroidaceae bacterium]
MSFLSIKNFRLVGLSAGVPENVIETNSYELLTQEQRNHLIQSTGVERRRLATTRQCTSDLCVAAAEKLMADLAWNREEIDLLVFASHTGDYKLPSTSCILQHRLGLSPECMAFDINHGCSGFLYGLSIIANLMSTGNFRKGLLLVGNTQSKNVSYQDKSTYMIFGDAGAVAALEYSADNGDSLDFHFKTDGSQLESVYIPHGGYRHPISPESFDVIDSGDGIKRNKTQLIMNGTDVFGFANKHLPKSVNALIEHYNIDIEKDVDYFVMHQANKFLCNKIKKKLGIPDEKAFFTYRDFGNTSGASIPLTMVVEMKEQLGTNAPKNILSTAIGGGFSLASAMIKVGKVHCSDLVIVKEDTQTVWPG